MNTSPTMWITISLVAGIAIGASGAAVMAQESQPTVPRERQFDTGHCWEYAIKEGYAATNIDDPQQVAHREARDAYAWLDAQGQTCG